MSIIYRLLFRLMENKTTGTWENKEVEMCSSNICQSPLQSTYLGGVNSFGLDEEGTTQGLQRYCFCGHYIFIFIFFFFGGGGGGRCVGRI